MPEVGGVGGGSVPAAPPSRGAGATPTLALRAGDTVQVEVHQVTARGQGTLRVAGQLLRAVFPGELPEGARVPLKVVSPGPPLVLQLGGTYANSL